MQSIGQQITDLAREKDFSGVISIFEGNAAIYNESFGFRDVANELPNEKDTKFGIASGTKLFTALGIGKLIEQGRISLGSRIRNIGSEYHTFISENATISHLLSHTSGIFDYYDEEIFNDSDDFFVAIPWYHLETPSDYLPLFKDQKAKFEPGERFSYSNGGYVFLGILIEKLSGKKYRYFIQDEIFRTSEMKNSGFFALNEPPKNTAIGYQKNRKTTNIYNIPIRGGGDGGMFTNTYDLNAFWQHLFSNRILNEELTDEFLKTQWKFNDKRGYGYGIYKELDDSMFYIVGGDAGVGFISRCLPKRNLVINILSNVTDQGDSISQLIMANL